nr:ABC transporter ATP-binding protein [uncultured Gemmiger sp.]
MIEVSHLTKRYGSHVAVDDISFTVDDGCIYGLLGPNGAGKSTTMNVITGYLSPTSGTVTINGHDIQEEPQAAKACIGYLPEIPPLYTDMTVREYLNFVAELKGVKKKADRAADVAKASEKAGLQEMQTRLIRNLSKGYRQRVGVAAALLGNPDIIILDEPTVGLDPAQMIEIRSLIHDLGKTHTVILSSHILSEVQTVCDRVLIISGGKLAAQGTPEELAARLAAKGVISATAQGSREAVLKAAGSVPGLTDLRVTAEKGDEVSFTAASTDGGDLRAALSAALAAAGCPVLSLSSQNLSLEDVFLQLTENDHPEEEAGTKAQEDNAQPAAQPEEPAQESPAEEDKVPNEKEGN